MRLLVFNYDNYVRGHAKCPVMTDVLQHRKPFNRRKSVQSLAGFNRDTKSVFKRKRNCFVPFSKIFASTYRFRIVIARPRYNAVSVLKTLLYPQCACSNELDACAFQYIAREIGAIRLDSLLLGVVVV